MNSQCETISRLEKTLQDAQAELARLKASNCTIAPGNNPENLTSAQIETDKGWRLLTREEILSRLDYRAGYTDEISCWQSESDGYWGKGKYQGNELNCVYRTLKPAGYFLPKTKPASENLMEGLKVGDYMVFQGKPGEKLSALTEGKLYQVTRFYGTSGWGVKNDNGNECSPAPSWYRKPTRAEIEKHLLDEAAKKGFVVGTMVESVWNEGKITKLLVRWPDDGIGSSVDVNNELKKGNPFVQLSFGPFYSSPLSSVTLVKDEPIKIVIDGTVYPADFDKTPGCVTFGCAKIGHWTLRAALNCIKMNQQGTENSNRDITAVQIGKGLFTKSLLEAIVKRIDSKDRHEPHQG